MATSLRNHVAADLRAIRTSLVAAEQRIDADAADGDMAPHELIEARALLSGIRARIAIEIVSLEQPPCRRVTVNG